MKRLVKRLKHSLQLSAAFVFIAATLCAPVAAAPYGTGLYGNCPYQTSCPAPTPPPEPTPTPPPPGEPEPDTNPDPNIVTADIDNDGNPEQATNGDSNTSNGFEQFNDPDGSSHVAATTDGEHNGTTSYLIDTDNNGTADVYWSPSDQYVAPVTAGEVNGEVVWQYENAKGQIQYYYPNPRTTKPATSTTPNNGKYIAPEDRRISSPTFGGAAYEKIGQIAQSVPKPVAYSFPYLLLILIGLLVARLIWQTKRELARLRLLLTNIEREKGLVLEKQNFLMLASHYLRTPLTAIKGNIELMQSLKQIPDAVAVQLQSAAAGMQTEANILLSKLEGNQNLGQITVSQTASVAWQKSLLSPFVIGPILAVIFLGVFANIIFADFRVTQPKLIDFLVQIALAAILIQWFVSSVRRRHINRQNRLDQQRVLDHQRELDIARSEFIKGATGGLSAQTAAFEQQLAAVAATGVDTTRIRKGLDQLHSVANKFVFAAQLQSKALENDRQTIDGATVVQDIVVRNQPKAMEKNISLHSQAQGGQITQNQALLNIVLDSFVDNAIKYSGQQGSVRVEQQQDGQAARFSVTDAGQGLSEEQLNTLFKPFSRAESAETFNTEGLGFSLYLDRLIMHYLGGDISIKSELGKGTQAELMLPTA